MRKKIRKIFFQVVVLTFCATLLSEVLFAQNKVQPPVWKSDEALLSQLDLAKSVEEFLINPPKGYVSVTEAGPEGSKITGWASEGRLDRTRGQLLVLTFTPPGGEVQESDKEPALDALVERLKIGKKDWKRQPIEHGSINGQPFVRTRWEGFEISFNRKLYGFTYLTIIGQKVIQLSSQDVEPHQKEALRLAEASVLTFKKH